MFSQYRKFEPRDFILCAVDTAAGMGDNTTAQFLCKNKLDVPLVFKSDVTTSDFVPKLAEVLERIYDTTQVKPVVALERQNGGSFLIDRLAGINLRGKYDIFKMPTAGNIENPEPTRLGWDTNTATRPKMLSDLKDAIDKKLIRIYDKDTINEMYSFVVVRSTSSVKAQAEQGSHDDLVMSLAISWQMYQTCENPTSNFNASLIPDDTQMFDKDGFY